MENNFWKNKRVLVTGCTGFLGAWLITLLLRSGADVVGIIRDRNKQSNFYQLRLDNKISIIHGTICDYSTVERAMNEYDVHTVFHLAAQAIIQVANRSPISTFESNIMGTINVLEAVRQTRSVERIVIASSDKAYGYQKKLPCKEDSQMQAQYPYDVSKLCTELLAKTYYETYFKHGNPKALIGITRCANLFGGGDFNWTRVIPRQIRNALNGFELQYNLCKRQFLYVLDAAMAYLSLAEKLSDELVNGEIFNFGMGEGISIKDLVRKHILDVCSNGKKLKVCQGLYSSEGEVIWQEENGGKHEKYEEYPPGEIREQYMSCWKAKHLMQWAPIYSFREGLEDLLCSPKVGPVLVRV